MSAARHPARLLLAGVVAAAVAAPSACVPVPQSGPRLATGGGAAGDDRDGDASPAGPPEWRVPAQDLDWGPCRTPPRTAAGVTAECASLTSPVDDDSGAAVRVPVLRLTTAATPRDAAPLVAVGGPEATRPELGEALASDAGLAAAHPIVVVAHRGAGTDADSCLSGASRRTLDGLAQRDVDPGSSDVRGELSDVAVTCTDAIEGAELKYGAAGAARDLETLRTAWRVPGLAVLGVGGGARTALAYATAHPEALSSLVLDSPDPWDGDQERATRTAVEGSEAALRQWAGACRRSECGAAGTSDRVATVTRALDAARDPRAAVPAARLSDAVRVALGDLSGASESSATAGDRVLGALSTGDPRSPSGALGEGRSGPSGDALAYVAGCTDLSRRVAVDRVAGLAAELTPQSEAFGPVLAAKTSACSTWPVPDPSPVSIPPDVPVLLLASAADPIAGAGATEPLAGALTTAGAGTVRTVTWQSPGSRVLVHSGCGRDTALRFLADPRSAKDSTACPS